MRAITASFSFECLGPFETWIGGATFGQLCLGSPAVSIRLVLTILAATSHGQAPTCMKEKLDCATEFSLTYKANPWPAAQNLAPHLRQRSLLVAPFLSTCSSFSSDPSSHRDKDSTSESPAKHRQQRFKSSQFQPAESLHQLTLLLLSSRPAFGLLKGTASTTASAAVSFVSDKDFSLCKPSHIINAIPPPAARLDAA
ncbi:hypothetical protein FALBO_10073 [Fusarium albosuccineum]|uniref:Uncharacterized protein n=1 Tax=Fusarium albosuccineum TaxID=1237068 RepID=A0A8H4L8H5_9HYPO|nr:hypothetical protein FALBO_10073 [Fusarium albosuccineum]